MLVENMGVSTPNDPVALFDFLFLSELPDEPVPTDELYRVMSLVADLGSPAILEWMIFLWPENPYKDLPDGDSILFDKILADVRSRVDV